MCIAEMEWNVNVEVLCLIIQKWKKIVKEKVSEVKYYSNLCNTKNLSCV